MADNTTSNITYELEGNKYDVLKLSQEAQSSYYVILEVEQEIRTLKKRIAVLSAASQTFNNQMKEHLVDEALIES